MVYKFTKEGKKRTDTFIRELEEKRKEFLDGGKDTADETNLPTADDILSDIEFVGISWDDPDGPCYYNGWGVTDNHDSDLPLLLRFERDFEIENKAVAEVVRIARQCHLTRDDLIREAELVEEYREWYNMSLMGYFEDELKAAAEIVA